MAEGKAQGFLRDNFYKKTIYFAVYNRYEVNSKVNLYPKYHMAKTIPSTHKIPVNRNVSRIQSGNFNENDVYQLLLSLRHFSDDNLFREIADFAAHKDRDKGLTHDSLNNLFLGFQLTHSERSTFISVISNMIEQNPRPKHYEQEEIIKSIQKVLKHNGIAFNRTLLLAQSEKIILCIP